MKTCLILALMLAWLAAVRAAEPGRPFPNPEAAVEALADAQVEGYDMATNREEAAREAFHGYYFKILTRQGRQAAGGKHNYVIIGNMIGGFALAAWPAQYGESGIMTFIVNQQGRVYQKDLGLDTGKLAPAMKAYDPDASWVVSAD